MISMKDNHTAILSIAKISISINRHIKELFYHISSEKDKTGNDRAPSIRENPAVCLWGLILKQPSLEVHVFVVIQLILAQRIPEFTKFVGSQEFAIGLEEANYLNNVV